MRAWKESVFLQFTVDTDILFLHQACEKNFLTEIFDVRQPAYLYHAV